MSERLPTPDGLLEGDRRERLLSRWLLPGGVTLVAMAVGFGLVGGLLIGLETLILGSMLTEALALAVMYLVPHVVVGFWIGRRQGMGLEPPIAAGVAPVVVFVFSLVLFDGPVATPINAALITVGAIAVWSAVFAAGMAAGARVMPER